jgi:hypothetical protein
MATDTNAPDVEEHDEVMGALRAVLAITARAVANNAEGARFDDVRLVALASQGWPLEHLPSRLNRPPERIADDIARLAAERFVVSAGAAESATLHILPRGAQLLEDIAARYRAEFERVLRRLDDRQREEFREALDTFPVIDALARTEILTLGLARSESEEV